MNHRLGKSLLFGICLLPLIRAGYIVFSGTAVNPVEFITHSTGTWALTFILLTLGVSPLRRLTGKAWLLKYRRMLGLYAFFYAAVHFAIYLWLDQMFDPHSIARDIMRRPFITVGFTALMLMLPLALTSTNGWIKRLGRHWRQLHRLVYPAAALGVLHYWWLVKSDISQPRLYAIALAALLAERMWHRLVKNRQ